VSYTYPFPRPALTVDVALFCARPEGLGVLLIRRGREPFKGAWALPGGFVDQDEDLSAAASRELLEETGLEAELGPQLGAYGAPGRDPRGHTVSVVYLAWSAGGAVPVQGRDDAVEATWHDARKPPRLGFDHARVLRDAVAELEARADRGLDALLPFMPRTFEVGAVRDLCLAACRPGSTAPSDQRLRSGLRAHPSVRELARRTGKLTFRKR